MRRFVVAVLLAGCSARPELPAVDPGLVGLEVSELQPRLVLPGTRLDLIGKGFADATRGSSRVRLEGTFSPSGGAAQAIDLTLPARFAEPTRLTAVADAQLFAALPAQTKTGRLEATLTVLTDSPLDRALHVSPPLAVSLDVAERLQPRLQAASGGAIFVNDAVVLQGDGFLLDNGEGATHAWVSGCFLAQGASGSCAGTGVTVSDIELVARPSRSPWDRDTVAFPFTPAVAGIAPGTFTGTVRVENRLASGEALPAGVQPLSVSLRKVQVSAITPTEASLGQIVDVAGGGFIGAAADEVTLLRLQGTFTRTGASQSAAVDLKLVPRFVSGQRVRYVLDESDALGKTLDLRRLSGRFTGKMVPIVRKGAVEVAGEGASVTLAVAPLKQVVYLRFSPSYVDSLRLYGLAAAEPEVRQRVLAVAARDYAGVNVEFRTEPPTDFALYSQVDLSGPDPNGLGLLGYDNTTGKDVGNQRLFDRIGGVNATTQSDGFPGYGGVFAEQFLGFSRHPAAQVARLPETSPAFDQLFDPVRPETGTPVTPAEARAGIIALGDGNACPADPRDRPAVVACAVFVLGNLIGSTLTHEVGHSLGLADPTGELFHNPGDAPNRLMDSGDGRPFEERAELMGQGPAVFCDAEFTYLRAILAASASPALPIARPACD